MQTPYTPAPRDAFLIAENGLAFALAAVAWSRSERPRWSRALMVLAIGVAASVLPAQHAVATFLKRPEDTAFQWMLALSLALATASAFAAKSRKLLLPAAILAQAAGYYGYAKLETSHDQTLEVSVLQLIVLGGLLGVERLAAEPSRRGPNPLPSAHFWRDDVIMGGLATLAAAATSIIVLHRQITSADEWAYTFQGALLAKFRAYAEPFPCNDAFQNYWVFLHDNKLFAQYTPGWPLFMAPFVRFRIAWLGGPFSLGILVIGLARLSRRAIAGMVPIADPHRAARARTGAIISALSVTLSSTMLINGGSRFSHVWIAAMWAWSMEALCVVTSQLPIRRGVLWGTWLGACLAWIIGTRPADGLVLGIGMFLFAVYAFARRRIKWSVVLAVLLSFGLLGGLFLVILRLQLGKWFVTGYSLAEQIHGWGKPAFSYPKVNELKWSFPFATGSYCWWPLTPAFALGGMIALFRSRERRLGFMLAAGVFASSAFYTALEFGRGPDFGYGPRFHLPQIVPMAIGAAVMLEPLVTALRKSAERRAAWVPAVVALTWVGGVLYSLVKLEPLVYPTNTTDIVTRNALNDAIKRANVTTGLVMVHDGLVGASPQDLTQNLPYKLYPNDILIAQDLNPSSTECVKKAFPERKVYNAVKEGSQLEVKPE